MYNQSMFINQPSRTIYSLSSAH